MSNRRRNGRNGASHLPLAHVPVVVPPVAPAPPPAERLPFHHAPACDGRHAGGRCNEGLREDVRRQSAALPQRRHECVRCRREWPLYALACHCGSRDWAVVG